MEFHLPLPADTLLFSDGLQYTYEEINEVIDSVVSEDSPFAIKNALQQLCSIIHYARTYNQFEYINQITALIIQQNLRRHETEGNIKIKIYLLYHLLNTKEISQNAGQDGLTKLIELLSLIKNKEISLYKVHMIKIMNRYKTQAVCMTVIQEVLDGVVETQTWGLFLRLLIKSFFEDDCQFQNAVLLVNALLQSRHHVSIGIEIQYKLIRYFMTVKEIPALKHFKNYLMGLIIMQPEHFLLDYEIFKPLVDHHFNQLRNQLIDIIYNGFEEIKGMRTEKNDQNIIDDFFQELDTKNLNEREKQELIDTHYRLIMGKLDIKKLDKLNPYNKNSFLRYVKRHPVGFFSKNIIPKAEKYEFENQHQDVVNRYFFLCVHKHYSKLSKVSHNNNRIEKNLWSMRKKLKLINQDSDVEMDENTKNKLEDAPRKEIDRRLRCHISEPEDEVDWDEMLELQIDFILDLQHYMLYDLLEKCLDQQYYVRFHAVKTVLSLLKENKFELSQYKLIADAMIMRIQDTAQRIRVLTLRIFHFLIQYYFKDICCPLQLKYFLSNLQIQGLVKYQQEFTSNKIKNINQFEFKIKNTIPQELLGDFKDNVNLKGIFSEARMIIKLIVKEGMEDDVIHHYSELIDIYQQLKPYILQNLNKFEVLDLFRPAIRIVCFTFSKRLIGSEQLFRESFNFAEDTQKEFMDFFSQSVYDVLVESTFNTRETVEEILQLVKYMTDLELEGFGKVWQYFLNRPEKFVLPKNFYKQVHSQLQYGSGNQIEALKVLQIYFQKFPILLNEHRLTEIKKLIEFEKQQPYQNILFLKQIITVLTRCFERSALQIVYDCQDGIFQIIAMNMGSFDNEWYNIIEMFFTMISENSYKWEARVQCCLYWMINVCKNFIQNDRQDDNRLIAQLNERGFTEYMRLDKRKVNLNSRPDTLKWIYEGLDICDYLQIPDIPGPNQGPLYMKKASDQDENDLLLTIASSKVLYQKYKKYSDLMPNALQTAQLLLSKKSFEMTVETYLAAQSHVIAGIGKFLELYGNKMDLIKYEQYLTVNQEDLEQEIVEVFQGSDLYDDLEHEYGAFLEKNKVQALTKQANRVLKKSQNRFQFFYDRGIEINRFFRRGVRFHRKQIKGDHKVYKQFVKKLRRQLYSKKQIKDICYKKREQKIDQYAVYKIYKKVNRENTINSGLSVASHFEKIMDLFSGLNEVNYILEQYQRRENVIYDNEYEKRYEKKQLDQKNNYKVVRKEKIKDILKDLQKITKGDKTINRRIKVFIKDIVMSHPKQKIFQILQENAEKIKDGTIRMETYKNPKTYYNTPPLEIIIKDRLTRISRLNQKYQEIKKITKNQNNENTIKVLNDLKYKMELEKIRGEVEEAVFDPEIRIILIDVQKLLKELLLRWCEVKEDHFFEMTKDFMLMILRNFMSLPEQINQDTIENPEEEKEQTKIYLKQYLLHNFDYTSKKNKGLQKLLRLIDHPEEMKDFNRKSQMEVEVEKKIPKTKQRDKIYQLTDNYDEIYQEEDDFEDDIEENQPEIGNNQDEVNSQIQKQNAQAIEEEDDDFQKNYPIQFVPYDIEGNELQEIVENKQQSYNTLVNLYLQDNKFEKINETQVYVNFDAEWFVDPRLSLKEQQHLLDLQRDLKIQLDLEDDQLEVEDYSITEVELVEFLASSQYQQVTKNEELLALHDEIKSDLLINPYVFLHLQYYCIKVLSCFKKETLELRPDSSCRINWEYVDGIHEKIDRYRVPLPKEKYWACKMSEYDIFAQQVMSDEEDTEEMEQNLKLKKELEQIEEESANSQSIEIENEEQLEQDEEQSYLEDESPSESSNENIQQFSDKQSDSNSPKKLEQNDGNQEYYENQEDQDEEAIIKKLSKKSRKIYKLVSEYYNLREQDKYRMKFFEILEEYEKDDYKNAKQNQLDILDDLMDLDNLTDDSQEQDDQEDQEDQQKQEQEQEIQEKVIEVEQQQEKLKNYFDEDEDEDEKEDDDEDEDEDEDEDDIDNEYLADIIEDDGRDPQEHLNQLQQKIKKAIEENSETDSINPLKIDDYEVQQEQRSEELYKASVVIMFLQDYFNKYDVVDDEDNTDSPNPYAMEIEEQDEINQDQEEEIDPELQYTFTKIIDQYARMKKTNIAMKLRQIKQQEKMESLQIAMKTKQNILDKKLKLEQIQQIQFTDMNEFFQINLQFLFPDQELEKETQFWEFKPIHIEEIQLESEHFILSNEIIEKINEINQQFKGKLFKVQNNKNFIINKCLKEDSQNQEYDSLQFAYQYQEKSVDEFYKILLDTLMPNDQKKSIFMTFCALKFNQMDCQHNSIQEMLLEFTKKQIYKFEKYTREELDKQEQKVEEDIAKTFFFEENDNFGEEQSQWLDKVRPVLGRKIQSLKLVPSIKQFICPRGAYFITNQWQPSRIYFIALNTYLKLVLQSTEIQEINIELLNSINSNPYTPASMKINIMYFLYEVISSNTVRHQLYPIMITNNIHLGDDELLEVTVKLLILLLKQGYLSVRDYMKLLLDALDTDCEPVKVVIHSYLAQLADNDHTLYFSVIFEVLDDNTPNRFKNIHVYMTYLRDFTYETLIEALLQSIGQETDDFLQFNAVYTIAMICSPSITEELNRLWEEIGNKFKEERSIIALAQLVHKFRHFCKKETFLQAVANFEQVYNLIRQKSDKVQSLPFDECPEWFGLIFNKQDIEQDQQFDQEYLGNDQEEKVKSSSDEIDEEDLQVEVEQDNAPVQQENKVDSIKTAIVQLIHRFFFTKNKKIKLEINEEILVQMNSLQIKDASSYYRNLEEVLQRIKTKIREKQMKKKTLNDRQIKENYKYYLQFLFDIQLQKHQVEEDEEEELEIEDQKPINTTTINSKFEQGRQLMETILNANSDIQKWVQMQRGGQRNIDDEMNQQQQAHQVNSRVPQNIKQEQPRKK